jgi:hypothetical protein
VPILEDGGKGLSGISSLLVFESTSLLVPVLSLQSESYLINRIYHTDEGTFYICRLIYEVFQFNIRDLYFIVDSLSML